MKPRILISVVLAVLVVGIAVYAIWQRMAESRFQGKTTAEWFKEFRESKTSSLTLAVFQTSGGGRVISVPAVGARGQQLAGSGFRALGTNVLPFGALRVISAPSLGLPSERQKLAETGLRGLGTNAVPFLNRQLLRREGAWQRVYPQLFTNAPSGLRKLLPSVPVPQDEIRGQAAEALRVLGQDGTGSIPALIEALKRCGALSEGRILATLSKLHYEPEDLDGLLTFLIRNGNYLRARNVISSLWVLSPTAARSLVQMLSTTNLVERRACISQLSYFERQAPIVLPALASLLNDPDRDLRVAAARVLEGFGEIAAPALPALEQALKHEDSELRYYAARAIEALGTNAVPAVPALTQATNDSSVIVRNVTARTLQKLNRH